MTRYTVKDTGYAWVILVASFLSNMVMGSMIMSPALFMVDWTEQFEATNAQIGVAGALWSSCACFTGLFLSPLISKFGCKRVQMFGSIMLTLFLVITSFATSVTWIYFTFGVLASISMGFCFLPPMVIVQFYFDKRRGLASGISLAGHSSGTFVIIPLLRFVAEVYGWRGAMIIHAGMALNLLVTASLFRTPVLPELNQNRTESQQCNEKRSEKAKLEDNNEKYTEANGLISAKNSCILNSSAENGDKVESIVEDSNFKHKTAKEKSILESATNFFKTNWDVTLLVNPLYSRYLVAVFASTLCGEITYKFTPLKAVSEGISKVNSSFLPSVIGFASTSARIVISLIADLPFLNRTFMFSIAAMCLGAACIVSCFAFDFITYVLSMALFGFALGTEMTLIMTVMVDLIGLQKFIHGSSFNMGATGFAMVIALVLAGFLADRINYDIPYYLYGSIAMLGGLLSLTLVISQKRKSKNSTVTEDNVESNRLEDEVSLPDAELSPKVNNRILNSLNKDEIIHASFHSLNCM